MGVWDIWTLTDWDAGTLVMDNRDIGKLGFGEIKHWDISILEYWVAGTLGHWMIEKLVAGTLGHVDIGSLGHWETGRLGGWDAGMLACGANGTLRHWESIGFVYVY